MSKEKEKDLVTAWSDTEKKNKKKKWPLHYFATLCEKENDDKSDEEKNKSPFNSSYEILAEYAEYSTIMGLIYLFFSYQTNFGRIFWIITIILMAILGFYWCIEAYNQWQERPVLTTIRTTAYAVESVEFPAVTFCGPGITDENMEAGFYQLILDFLDANKMHIDDVNPYNASSLLKRSDSTLSASHLQAKEKLKAFLSGPLYQKFLNASFPGLLPGDDVVSLVKLLTSKDPDGDITAAVALEGGIDESTSSTFQKKNTLDLILDPNLKSEADLAIARKKSNYKNMLSRIDFKKAYESLFSILYMANLPCFDTRGFTAEKNGERGNLKYCEWKGKHMSCSAIFTTFPSDQGMCCSFNMQAADEIFLGNQYPNLVKKLQDFDRNYSFTDSQLPLSYINDNEPKSLPGRNKGLVVMLDAHRDLLSAGSMDIDFHGFLGFIGSNRTYPRLNLEGFEILGGHRNIITLTATKIDAEPGLEDLDMSKRNCRFPYETDGMKIHKHYSFDNCIFECALFFAQNKSVNGCIPWYFPSAGDEILICDPWQTLEFLKDMANVPEEKCENCLSDCSTTLYQPYLIPVPFSKCDSYNLGVSKYCNIYNKNFVPPTKYDGQILAEYQARQRNDSFLKDIQSTTRTHAKIIPGGDVFTLNPKTYEAFDQDVAVVRIFFQKSTVLQIGSQPRMTWIDYFSTVGGLLGLVLGMGIISFIEVIWVCCRMVALKTNMTHWVR